METHSLFSLEIVVEKLYLPNISCRFPTIACKLLDFPIITIDLLEKSTAESIRNKVKSQPDWTLPDQFENFKSSEDTFLFKHGKSCLFKICPQTLKSLLLNVPMYVMILDTLPNTPKLTGNASVPLDVAIRKICKDLNKNGPDIPVIYKDTGLLRVYNLMGKEIGYMTFGYRLLYLGSTLLPHITVDESKMESEDAPQQMLMPGILENDEKDVAIDLNLEMTVGNESKNKEEALRQGLNVGKNVKAWNSSTEHTENVQTVSQLMLMSDPLKDGKKFPEIISNTQKLQRAISQAERSVENMDPNKNANLVISEQVSKTRVDHQSRYLKVPIHDTQIPIQNLDDLEIEPKEKDPHHLYRPPPIFYWKCNSKILSSETELLNNQECDVNIDQVHQTDEQLSSGDLIKDPQNNSSIKVEKETLERMSGTLQDNAETKTANALSTKDLNKYPYLCGILKELSLIDISGAIQQIIGHIKERHSEKSSGASSDHQRAKSKQRHAERTARQAPMNDGGAEKKLPKNKSWIRCTKQFSGRKSSLEYGLTKTHILRLNKLNLPNDNVNTTKKIQKMEKKLKMDTVGSETLKSNHTMLQEKSSKTVRNEVNMIKERNEKRRNEVNFLRRRMDVVKNEVNVLMKQKEAVRNKVTVSMKREEDIQREGNVTTERDENVRNEVNVMTKERNDVANEINDTVNRNLEVGVEVKATMKRRYVRNEVNIMQGQNEVQEQIPKNGATKYGQISMREKQKETDPWRTMTMITKKETDLGKKSSIMSDTRIDDESLVDRIQQNGLVSVGVYSKGESVESFQNETADENDKFVTSDDDKSYEKIQENKNESFVDLQENQSKESVSWRKQDSLTATGSISEDDRLEPNQGDVDSNKVLSFEKSLHPNFSPLVPIPATTPQHFLSRGLSLQESNASSSSRLSETPLPTPRTRRFPLLAKKGSIHTDSVSSYRPSEDNEEVALSSSSKHSGSPEDYSEDFLTCDSETESDNNDKASLEEQHKPNMVSANRLGYTIW